MSFCVTNGSVLVLCGRHFLHAFRKGEDMVEWGEPIVLHLHPNIPKGSKDVGDEFTAVCCDISKTGKYIVGADSENNVFVFEEREKSYEFFASWQMEKRLVKVQFDPQSTFLIMTDKTGDIYLSYLTLKTITSPRRALGHTSFILDVTITQDNTQIITCDRDEKIRISQFPTAYQVLGFNLGHTEAVISVALVNSDKHLISITARGNTILWDMSQNKAVKTWDAFDIIGVPQSLLNRADVLRMKATDVGGKVYMSVLIFGVTNIHIFEIKPLDLSIRKFGQVELREDFTDMTWWKDALYTYNPVAPIVKRYHVTEFGIISDTQFKIPLSPTAREDLPEFEIYNKPDNPPKRRLFFPKIKDAKYQKIEEDGAQLKDFTMQASTSNTVGIGPDSGDPSTNTTR